MTMNLERFLRSDLDLIVGTHEVQYKGAGTLVLQAPRELIQRANSRNYLDGITHQLEARGLQQVGTLLTLSPLDDT